MLTKVKYWSSSPRLVSAEGLVEAYPQHLVLMSVKQGDQPEKTVSIAKCTHGFVSKRIAELLDKAEGQ